MSRRKSHKPTKQSHAILDRTVLLLIGATVGVLALVTAIMLINQQQNNPPAGFEPEVTGAPRVEVAEGDVVDYGDVELDTTIETVYHVQNVGDKPLQILGEPQVELVEGC